MNTASKELAERVAARNAIETAKARREYIQMKFIWNYQQDAGAGTPSDRKQEGGAL